MPLNLSGFHASRSACAHSTPSGRAVGLPVARLGAAAGDGDDGVAEVGLDGHLLLSTAHLEHAIRQDHRGHRWLVWQHFSARCLHSLLDLSAPRPVRIISASNPAHTRAPASARLICLLICLLSVGGGLDLAKYFAKYALPAGREKFPRNIPCGGWSSTRHPKTEPPSPSLYDLEVGKRSLFFACGALIENHNMKGLIYTKQVRLC